MRCYMEDGNCILCVQDILFKVNRHHPSPRSEVTVFTDIFSLPPGTGVVEGKEDESPIRLTGDTVNEIRAFLSFSYASPLQTMLSRIPDADLQRLATQAASRAGISSCQSKPGQRKRSARLPAAPQARLSRHAQSMCIRTCSDSANSYPLQPSSTSSSKRGPRAFEMGHSSVMTPSLSRRSSTSARFLGMSTMTSRSDISSLSKPL
ncbi:hypothetical protein DFH08DRAFT_867452 [Mycena albidolilacea]|uniref:Uncharacterized protein n=1 Tax=Mycena albidolilacea TaxID=1033008 RepID=A0AAD7A2D8_9AGAR|nr:hypothetical protein DFH08DRAFT_867452 [Mycena albidolilacea]